MKKINIFKIGLLFLLVFCSSFSCNEQQSSSQISNSNSQNQAQKPSKRKKYSINIIRTFDHDPEAFTQGLVYLNDKIYESTGLNGRSSLRIVDPKDGKVIKKKAIDREYFGEGIAIIKDKIYMLTYTSQLCLVYDLKTFEQIGKFTYTGEGWGLTTDCTNLIMSNGSNEINIIDPETFKVIKKLEIYDFDGVPQVNINELEYVNGTVWANIWQSDKIINIDLESGEMITALDGSIFRSTLPTSANIDVLNGITYNPASKTYYFTGKLWPKMFEVNLIEIKD